jgi:hypothetical protein
MANEKQREEEIGGVRPEVVQDVVEGAQNKGVPPEVAKEIIRDAVEEGVAPEELKEVAEEAIEVEREDRASGK